jgi:hypothetical protein
LKVNKIIKLLDTFWYNQALKKLKKGYKWILYLLLWVVNLIMK